MARLWQYVRLKPCDLQAALDYLRVTPERAAWFVGVPLRRMEHWLSGEEDIPHVVGVLMVALCHAPKVLGQVETFTESVATRSKEKERTS